MAVRSGEYFEEDPEIINVRLGGLRKTDFSRKTFKINNAALDRVPFLKRRIHLALQ